MKIIRLLVEVTNSPAGGKLAEDAHQAMLNVTIPDALRYSGVRSLVGPLEGSRRLRNLYLLVISSIHVLNNTADFFLFVCHQYVKVASLQFSLLQMHLQSPAVLNLILLFSFSMCCVFRTTMCNAVWTTQ